MRSLVIIVTLICLGGLGLRAAEPDIIDHITACGHKVTQPAALRALLRVQPSNVNNAEAVDLSTAEGAVTENPAGYTTGVRMAGFRVQIFSDNNRNTAKNEARSKARKLQNAFPQYRTYVVYTSPYWRLKVGDFGTRSEAEAAAEEIRNAFPLYAKEIRVVRDNINGTVY